MTQMDKFKNLNGRFVSLEIEMTPRHKFRDRGCNLLNNQNSRRWRVGVCGFGGVVAGRQPFVSWPLPGDAAVAPVDRAGGLTIMAAFWGSSLLLCAKKDARRVLVDLSSSPRCPC